MASSGMIEWRRHTKETYWPRFSESPTNIIRFPRSVSSINVALKLYIINLRNKSFVRQAGLDWDDPKLCFCFSGVGVTYITSDHLVGRVNPTKWAQYSKSFLGPHRFGLDNKGHYQCWRNPPPQVETWKRYSTSGSHSNSPSCMSRIRNRWEDWMFLQSYCSWFDLNWLEIQSEVECSRLCIMRLRRVDSWER